ncbi:MAG: DNA-directed RNA polymerase subunit L [Candidatus Diapherotrites archaeon]|uniref:DNA-directed RNA polymerase subunit Rpo11 n=1 Tax=Candidatus Iainarchaeum sp. TaxID=3101447 RepID=A0A8T3YK78_9ARCH|nr:DNA-directed RNA polymerase subunit L [Candidatus Diapherotrites archaeon]
MKLTVLKDGKDLVEFVLDGERHTFPGLLKSKLIASKDVQFVSYMLDHPTDKKARFILRTNGRSPKKVLDEAAKEIEGELEDFGKKVKKAIK